nr:putative threonine aspartase [Quercus suber]
MIIFIKDDPCTNAGRGSNLTEDGRVECDASIMDGHSGAFGAVGAVPGVQNAIQIAALLAKEQMTGSPLLGRIPPIFLVGEGARTWAKSKGIALPATIAEADEWLITERAKALWKKYKAMVDDAKTKTDISAMELSSSPQEIVAILGNMIHLLLSAWYFILSTDTDMAQHGDDNFLKTMGSDFETRKHDKK